MKPLYIGIRGLAGSGKDTVGNFLSFVLDNDGMSLDEIKLQYNQIPRCEVKSRLSDNVFMIAFADQLKLICSNIFGISIEPFYTGRKNEAWVCLDDFTYTETQPNPSLIVSALDYYGGERPKGCYMSIREIMVYVGTYMLQSHIGKNIFVNIVENAVRKQLSINKDLKYVIITDVRFEHELNYIKNNGGIVINVENNRVQRLSDIAENSLDECFDYDYVIENNSSYDDLYEYIYDLVKKERIFDDNTYIELNTRTFDVDNFLRVHRNGVYRLCTNTPIKKINKENGKITMIDPIGGPVIEVGQTIPGTSIRPTEIVMDDSMRWWIYS